MGQQGSLVPLPSDNNRRRVLALHREMGRVPGRESSQTGGEEEEEADKAALCGAASRVGGGGNGGMREAHGCQMGRDQPGSL